MPKDNHPSSQTDKLWQAYTRHVEKIERPNTVNPFLEEPGPAKFSQSQKEPKKDKHTLPLPPSVSEPAPPAPAKGPAPLDPNIKRKIARARVTIERTLDLHGQTRHQAHQTLLHFLNRCHREQIRTVLVITGKGSLSQPSLIRQDLPLWMETATFQGYVSSYAPAARAHGGDGAFYIRLKK